MLMFNNQEMDAYRIANLGCLDSFDLGRFVESVHSSLCIQVISHTSFAKLK